MYCIKCGANNPDVADFCHNCGKELFRSDPRSAGVVSSVAPTSAIPESPTRASESATAKPSTSSNPPVLCSNITGGSAGATQAAAIAPAAQRGTTEASKSAPSRVVGARINYGTIVFAAFSMLSLLVCLAKGIVPLYLGESALWAVAAWYWHKKGPRSEAATGIVLLLAVAFAAGEGYVLGRQSLGNGYTYLTQGKLQYRVNTTSGRTDMLAGIRGWEPVSFNTAPETINRSDAAVLSVKLSNGVWEHPDGPLAIFDYAQNPSAAHGKICFDVRNDSHYVLREVVIGVTLEPKPPGVDDFYVLGGDSINLEKEAGGLLDVGKSSRFCGAEPRPLPTGAKWTYVEQAITGWKQ